MNGKILKGSAPMLISNIIPFFFWISWGKQQKSPFRVACLRIQIWNLNLPNTEKTCCTFERDFGQLIIWKKVHCVGNCMVLSVLQCFGNNTINFFYLVILFARLSSLIVT